jgi:Zn finger protein HypA/HybF involved in hydrogenase expression
LKPYFGPPATLGSTAAAHLQLIVWCKDCHHRVEPHPAKMAARYGAEMTVPDWRERLVCSQCGSRNVDMVVSGSNHDPHSG